MSKNTLGTFVVILFSISSWAALPPTSIDTLTSKRSVFYSEIKSKIFSHEQIRTLLDQQATLMRFPIWENVQCTDEPEGNIYFCQIPLSSTSNKKAALFFQVNKSGSPLQTEETQVSIF